MKILAIETSCDETGVTIFEASGGLRNPSFRVLANALASQAHLHKEYGGVYPSLAKREHIKNLPILLERVLKKIKQTSRNPVDLIAVTSGPGLEPALWTGIVFAQNLAREWGVPVMPVNHMEGHIFSVFGDAKKKFTIPGQKFPVLSLLVSGGHTELVLVRDLMKYQVLGETLDDAAGEAFDKVARMLGLPYPGGPEISRLAEEARMKEKQDLKGLRSARSARTERFSSRKIAFPESSGFSFKLPRPMIKSPNFNFSFSGLKTAVLYLVQKIGPLDDAKRRAIALEFENAAVETLVAKTARALEAYKPKTLIVAGGVASNKYLRAEIKKAAKKTAPGAKVLFPGKALATDNSVMIGIAGYMQYLKRKGKTPNPARIRAEGTMRLSA